MVTVVLAEPHHSVVKTKICWNCGATLKYVPKDIKEEVQTDYIGGKDRVRFIECPPCGHKLTVK